MNEQTALIKKLIADGDLSTVAMHVSYHANRYEIDTGRRPDIVHLPCTPAELENTMGQSGNYVTGTHCARPKVVGLEVIFCPSGEFSVGEDIVVKPSAPTDKVAHGVSLRTAIEWAGSYLSTIPNDYSVTGMKMELKGSKLVMDLSLTNQSTVECVNVNLAP